MFVRSPDGFNIACFVCKQDYNITILPTRLKKKQMNIHVFFSLDQAVRQNSDGCS